MVIALPTPAKLLDDWDCIAVVKNAGIFNDNPELFTVHATPLAVKAVFKPIASLLALAVVRWLDKFNDNPPVPNVIVPFVIAEPMPAKFVEAFDAIAVVR